MEEIAFNGYFINKCTYWLIATWPVIWVVVFATLDIPREDRFCLSTGVMAVELYFVFYLNRFEPKLIKFDNENIEIGYSNYKFFEIKDKYYSKSEIKALKVDDVLILSRGTRIIAKLRRKALDAEDWETLKNYFKV